MKYPLRPATCSYDPSEISAVRYKPASRRLEVEIPSDETTDDFSTTHQALASTETQVQDGYCVATIHEGIFYVTAINSVFQMRPCMAHLNVNEERKKEHAKSCDLDRLNQVRPIPKTFP